MEFGVSGQNIASHQFVGVRRGRFGGQRTPSVGPRWSPPRTMRSTGNPTWCAMRSTSLRKSAGRIRCSHRTGRLELEVASINTDLIAGFCLREGRFDDEGVRRAHRRDAGYAGPRDGVEGMTQAVASLRIVAHMCSFSARTNLGSCVKAEQTSPRSSIAWSARQCRCRPTGRGVRRLGRHHPSRSADPARTGVAAPHARRSASQARRSGNAHPVQGLQAVAAEARDRPARGQLRP